MKMGVQVVMAKGRRGGSLMEEVGMQRAEDPGEVPEPCIMRQTKEGDHAEQRPQLEKWWGNQGCAIKKAQERRRVNRFKFSCEVK